MTQPWQAFFRLEIKKLMTRPLLLLLSLLPLGAYSQQPPASVPEEILNEIAADVWIPFMEAYRDLDSEKLKALHAPDIMRITIDQNRVETGAAYLDKFGGYLQQVQSQGIELGIDFSIATSAIDADQQRVYQTGHYRFSSKQPEADGFQVNGYGYFNVLLKKDQGKWRLLMDADQRVEMDEAAFFCGSRIYSLSQPGTGKNITSKHNPEDLPCASTR
jgi:ketosteroid isomerase-like protein